MLLACPGARLLACPDARTHSFVHSKHPAAMWHRLCTIAECPPGQGRELVAGERIVALFNVDGQFHALDGICPHQGGPLGKGVLRGCIVTCPWHGFQFDVTSGQHQASASLRQGQFATKLEGEEVWADIPT